MANDHPRRSADRGDDGGAAVSFVQMSHRYDAGPVVTDISLTVPRGEFCVLIGPSGCGKTTCLDAIAGEVVPTSGAVTVLGEQPAPGNQRIGYMFARDALFPWRTAWANVALALESRRVPRADRRRRAVELLDTVGLAGAADLYPAQLSQGMRQRLALARTFALDAELLLMDEPFAALDAQSRMLLEQELTRLWERDSSTVVFVTHDLAEAIVLGDRVVVFSAAPGRIKREFTVPLPRPRSITRLRSTPAFHELYEAMWAELEDEVRD